MKNASKLFDWTLNALSVLCIVLVLGVFIQRHFSSSADPEARNVLLQKGTQISLPDVRWSDSPANLVMALAVGCHYCQESAGFYRNLIAANANNAFRPIAVLPQQVSQSKEYLRAQGIGVTDVLQGSLSDLGVTGTPTLILVSGSGRVESAWVGKLSTQQEADVYRSLGIRSPSGTLGKNIKQGVNSLAADLPGVNQDLVNASQLFRLLHKKGVIPIVDIRQRTEYAVGHIAGSLNIPLDELEERAEHEVPQDSVVILYCDYSPVCEAGANARSKATYCSTAVSAMHEFGFPKIMLISAKLAELRGVGVSIVGESNASSTN